ncbi:MAG TPA: T9SS type A sorting domain-containing protein, partial [bacterium]|nr:T9SS type A sorting domain-containing protein [bacterium]
SYDEPDHNISDLLYATKFEGLWIHEVVDQAEGAYTSLALDASGNPCISYITSDGDEGNGGIGMAKVKFARKEGGIWTKEVVCEVGPNAGSHTSLAIDSNGNPHISYASRDQDNVDHVMYARKSGDIWSTEIVGGFGIETSIDLDAQDQPWISYRDGTASSILKLATKQYGSWTIQTVDSNAPAGVSASMMLDSQDLPWIGYSSPSVGDIRVAIPNVGAVGVEPFVANDSFVGAPFPNPARGTVSLAIHVPHTDSVRLTLFDVGGRMISRIPGQEFQGGSRVVTWNPKDVESGVYFLRVESSSGIHETRQVTIIR